MEPRWRVGRKLGRTLYVDGVCVGMVDTTTLAEAIVYTMNRDPRWAPVSTSQRCSECRYVGVLDNHLPPSGTCPNTSKVAIREPV